MKQTNKMSLKDFIWLKMAEGHNPTDQELFKFLGKEPNFATCAEYHRQYKSFQHFIDYFKEYETNPNSRIWAYRNSYRGAKKRYSLIPHKDINESYKISLAYYDYLRGKGVAVENSR